MRLPPERIRVPREAPQPSLTVATYESEFRIAYGEPENVAREGSVTLDAVIGKDGIIQTLAFRSGDAALTDAAIETARHWTYRPVLLNGRPVEIVTEIDVHFTT